MEPGQENPPRLTPRPGTLSVGVAIIGNGMATRVFHAPYIRAAEMLDLRAVVSRNPDAAPPFPGAPMVGSVEAVLDDPAIDLVVIATPSQTHAAMARAALLAGKHVVVEKPFALDLAEARAILDLAAAQNRHCAVFHNRRRDSDFLAVRQAIASGLIGEVVHFESHFDRFRPHVRDRWREQAGPGAGVWFDLGPHLVDQALLLFGAPDAVSADIAALRAGAGADDWAHVTLHYPNTRVILHAGMVVAGGSPRFVVHGLKGSVLKQALDRQEAQSVAGMTPADPDWGHDPDPLIHWDESSQERHIPAPVGSQHQFYAQMADACLGLGPPPTRPEEILLVQSVLDAARQAAETGQRVILPK